MNIKKVYKVEIVRQFSCVDHVEPSFDQPKLMINGLAIKEMQEVVLIPEGIQDPHAHWPSVTIRLDGSEVVKLGQKFLIEITEK